MPVAIALGGVVLLLFHLREPLHQFAGRMGEKDIRAIMQFVFIALVILPVLPDRSGLLVKKVQKAQALLP